MASYELIFIFFIVAAVYASAGFGGGSSYLAAMSLFGLSMAVMKPASLLCNIVVVTGGTYIFWQNGYLSLKKIWPLALASVPMAFLGGSIPLREKTFFTLLGSSLVLISLLMLFQHRFSGEKPVETPVARPYHIWVSTLLGGAVGLLSGMVGIGGGIFLSPILHLLRWDVPKRIAATASFFILVNSIAGLSGQLWQHAFKIDWAFVGPLLAAVLLGGQIGSRVSTLRFKQRQVLWATALLVFYAGVNVLWNRFKSGQ